MIDTQEKLEKAEAILKKEGKYLDYLKMKKRNPNHPKLTKMIEDLFNRYGQNLDGDLEFKHNDTEEVKL